MKQTICGVAVLAALISAPVLAHQEGDFIVRAGIASVVPNDSSDKILGSQSELSVNSDTQLGLTLGYMFTDNISFEVLAATPFSHKISTDLSNLVPFPFSFEWLVHHKPGEVCSGLCLHQTTIRWMLSLHCA